MSAPDAVMKPGDGKGEEVEDAGPKCGGEVLFCGGTNWESMGRRSVPVAGNLLSPTRLRPLMGVDIRFVASGCTSCHCVALDVEGRCYTWGRNEKGQLGHGDTLQRNLPTIVAEFSKYRIVTAGAGRNHTVVVTKDGKSFSFGGNKHGQLGTGSTRNEFETSPVACMVSQATNAVCGADFTLWLSSVEGSSILTAGLPQYGQLGHGTENQYNARDSSIRLVYEPQPRPRAVAAFSEKTVVKVACGTNHTVAVDSSGFVYTWGFGGYGRLGHREQKDEWVPRLVEVFQKQNVLPPTAIVSAGSVSSACTAGGGQLYMWGKLKNTGDDWMYPKPVMDLSGWNIHCMDSGNMHHVIGADQSCISWGVAQYGELGYGPLGQKSSANPKKVDILEDMHVTSVACGMGLSLIVVDRVNIGDRLDQLEVYDGDVLAEENADHSSMWRWGKKLGDREAGDAEKELATSIKRTPKKHATDSSAKTRKKKKRSSSESDDEYGASDDSKDANHGVENIKRGRGGKVSGGGRGRKSKNALTVKSSQHGRGRSKSNENSSGRGLSRPNTEEKTSGRGHGRATAGKKAKVSR